MMKDGAPFRDLFVELPSAVFDALQGIAEQAVRSAPALDSDASRISSRRSEGAILVEGVRQHEQVICGVYGWESAQAVLSAMNCEVWIVAHLPCGHRVKYRISDKSVIIDGPVEALNRAVEAKPRTCYCVPRQLLGL